jgi:hypothetical protein
MDSDRSINGDELEGNKNETFDESAVSAAKLASSNPLKKVERKSNTKPHLQDEIQAVGQYLESLISITHCFSKHNKKFTSCNCLHHLQHKVCIDSLAARLGTYFSFCFCDFYSSAMLLNFNFVDCQFHLLISH